MGWGGGTLVTACDLVIASIAVIAKTVVIAGILRQSIVIACSLIGGMFPAKLQYDAPPPPRPPPLLMAPRRRVVGYRILSLWKSVQSAVTSHRAAGVARTPPVGLATPKASLRRQRWGTAVPWPGGGGAHPARQWKNLPEAVWGHLLDI